MTYDISEIHTVSITNDNAKPTNGEKNHSNSLSISYSILYTSFTINIQIHLQRNPWQPHLCSNITLLSFVSHVFCYYTMIYSRQQLTKNLTMLLFDFINRICLWRDKTEIKLWFQKEKNKCYAKQTCEQNISKTEKKKITSVKGKSRKCGQNRVSGTRVMCSLKEIPPQQVKHFHKQRA